MTNMGERDYMPKYSQTQKAILDAGKQEFLKKGCKDANLRHIAAQAGVTTGAIYGYFSDKHELFSALVEPVATDFYEQFVQVMVVFNDMPESEQVALMHTYSDQALKDFFDYVYEYFDVFRLIKCCSAGTEYERYIERMVDVEAENSRKFIIVLEKLGYSPAPISDNLLHILVNAYFSTIFEAVELNMQKDEAQAYVEHIASFFNAGWDSLLKIT